MKKMSDYTRRECVDFQRTDPSFGDFSSNFEQ